MDNLGKAFQMSAGPLLLVIALTTSVMLYGSIIDYANVALETSTSDRRAEIMVPENMASKREVHRSEIIASLLAINETDINIKLVLSNGNYYIYRPAGNGKYNKDTYSKTGTKTKTETNIIIKNQDFSTILDNTYLSEYSANTNTNITTITYTKE